MKEHDISTRRSAALLLLTLLASACTPGGDVEQRLLAMKPGETVRTADLFDESADTVCLRGPYMPLNVKTDLPGPPTDLDEGEWALVTVGRTSQTSRIFDRRPLDVMVAAKLNGVSPVNSDRLAPADCAPIASGVIVRFDRNGQSYVALARPRGAPAP